MVASVIGWMMGSLISTTARMGISADLIEYRAVIAIAHIVRISRVCIIYEIIKRYQTASYQREIDSYLVVNQESIINVPHVIKIKTKALTLTSIRDTNDVSNK
jgi:hypothetical protein